MTWITAHWEKKYISDAETKIKKAVSLFMWGSWGYSKVVLP